MSIFLQVTCFVGIVVIAFLLLLLGVDESRRYEFECFINNYPNFIIYYVVGVVIFCFSLFFSLLEYISYSVYGNKED